MPNFFKDEQDKYQEDPMVTMVKELKDIKEYMKRMTEDIRRIQEDVNRIERKVVR